MPIEVVPYDADWPMMFERIRADLERALEGIPIRAIEHVGSTSVPGLVAKPVIDVDVVVPGPAVGDAIAALTRIGYRDRGDLGIPNRYALEEPSPPRRNVYVVVAGSLALRNHLAVRDALRADADLRESYARLKADLRDRFDVVDDYSVAKTEFLVEILERAGLTREEIAEVATANRPRPS